jgi:hypothetical protein
VTLVQGVPAEVRDMTLTFRGYSPAVDGSGRDRMAVEVARGGDSFIAYPKMFLNPRTRQLMVNPHVESFVSGDLYFSPLEFNPGDSAGNVREVELPKGGEQRFDDLVLTFVDFDMNKEGNALVAMQSGGKVTIGARLLARRGENAEPMPLEPVYIFDASGQVEFPALPLPGGGQVAVAGINASTGSVRLLLDGVGLPAGAKPPELSLDVTAKPLIGLVWYGLYVVLAGGLLAYFERLRSSRGGVVLPPAAA